MTGRLLLAALLAGWLADRLARPDRDVEAGIEAYEAGDLDAALERFEAAIARHGDRPELSLDRGLVLLAQGEADAARRAFERASESDDFEVRSSAFYERGNVAFDAEDWDAAIEAYIECLKARPEHANAKWNLELARKRKQEQEKEEEEEKDDEEQDETGGEDSGGSTSEDSGDSTGEDSGSSSGDDGSGGSSGDDGSGGSSGDDGSGGSGGSGEPPPDQGGSSGDQGEQENDPKDQQQPPPPPPPPLDQMDLQKALDDLDEQDHFVLDRPSGGVRPPPEDW